jgi:hypothetical protein
MCAACMIFFDLSVGALHFASVCTDLLDDVIKFGGSASCKEEVNSF